MGRRLLLEVYLAGSVLAYRAVPAVAIACDPRVKLSRHPANSRNQQNPCQEFPSRQQHSDPRPGIATTEDASIRIDSQHPAHGFLDRKSTRLNSSHDQISYAVFCLKKKNN